MTNVRVQMQGLRYGRLTVIDQFPMLKGQKQAEVLAFCDCGTTRVYLGNGLRNGKTRSCGCLKREIAGGRTRTHGMSRSSSAYKSWIAMRERCSNPSHHSYSRYGGRGIRVCDRWDSFENFLADMGERHQGLSIDRRDPNGNYQPDNCYWATNFEQARTRRDNLNLTINGETKCLTDWCREAGTDYEKARVLIRRKGIDPQIAIAQAPPVSEGYLMKTAPFYVFIVRRNVACVIDWYGNPVTKDMPTAFARRYVARFGAAS